MKKTRKNRKKKLKEIKIPDKIHEVISYLAFSFSSKLLERDDNKQFLYLKYVELIRKNPKCESNLPGWFFLRFKWLLLTRYRNSIHKIQQEWDYILRDSNDKSKRQGEIGYLESNEEEGE